MGDAVLQVENITGFKAKEVCVGRGHSYKGEAKVHIAGMGRKRLKTPVRKWIKLRPAIEELIGYAKTGVWLGQNYLH